jgi:hypothetical protein
VEGGICAHQFRVQVYYTLYMVDVAQCDWLKKNRRSITLLSFRLLLLFPYRVESSAAVRACGRAVTLSLFAFITEVYSCFLISRGLIDASPVCRFFSLRARMSPCHERLSAERPALSIISLFSAILFDFSTWGYIACVCDTDDDRNRSRDFFGVTYR